MPVYDPLSYKNVPDTSGLTGKKVWDWYAKQATEQQNKRAVQMEEVAKANAKANPTLSKYLPPGLIGAMELPFEMTIGPGMNDATRAYIDKDWEKMGYGIAGSVPGVGKVSGAIQAAATGAAGKAVLGAGAAAMFAGRRSKTAPLKDLKRAQKMEAEGIDRDTIWKKIGWGRGADEGWRYEINDRGMRVNKEAVEHGGDPNPIYKLPVTASIQHKELYEAYDHLKQITVKPERRGGIAGSFDDSTNELSLSTNPKVAKIQPPETVAGHELQHSVQDFSGWAQGGNPHQAQIFIDKKMAELNRLRSIERGFRAHADELYAGGDYGTADMFSARADNLWDEITELRRWEGAGAFETYEKLMGETEARNVQTRLKWGKKKRREIPPWRSQDTPTEDQIKTFDVDDIDNAVSMLISGDLGSTTVNRGMTNLKKRGGKISGAPPHITNARQVNSLVKRLMKLAEEGQAGRYWYRDTGEGAMAHLGGDIESVEALAGGYSVFSPQTGVPANAQHAVKAFNQQLPGKNAAGNRVYPTDAGTRPAAMGKRYDEHLAGEENTTLKTGPFLRGSLEDVMTRLYDEGQITQEQMKKYVADKAVNDIWNMRAYEFPHPKKPGKLYEGTPTIEQHRFTQELTDRITGHLNRGINDPTLMWDRKQVQAAIWVAKKMQKEKRGIGDAKTNFTDALGGLYAHSPWESMPGKHHDMFPMLREGTNADRVAYHQDINQILTRDGRDVIAMEMGAITGKSFDAPGIFEGFVSPGTKARIAVAPKKGVQYDPNDPTKTRSSTELDPASMEVLENIEMVRGILLEQDAIVSRRLLHGTQLAQDKNAFLVDTGDTAPTPEQLEVWAKAFEDIDGAFVEPTPTGFHIYNSTEEGNEAFHKLVRERLKVIAKDTDVDIDGQPYASDGFYFGNDWKENPNGQVYRERLGTRSPSVQRRADAILSKYGPQVRAVQDRWRKKLGARGPRVRITLGDGPPGGVPQPEADLVGDLHKDFPNLK